MFARGQASSFTLGVALFGLCSCSSSSLSGSATPDAHSTKTVKATAAGESAALPSGAVKKGSFTVWAVPSRPARWEDYQVFIRVALPVSTANYRQEDLSGQLAGTDHYKQDIQASFHSKAPGTVPAPLMFTPEGQSAKLMFWVPGANALVQDTIDVSSKLLHENQSITIQFQ